MAKPNFILPNKPAIKAGSILSYNYTDDLKFAAEPLDFSRNSSATRVNEQGLIEEVGYFGPQLVQNGNFSQEGSELITNGDFSDGSTRWNLTNFSIINEKAVIDSSSPGYLTQTSVAGIGKTYRVEFTVSDYVEGRLRLRNPFINNGLENNPSNGTYVYYGVADETGFDIQSRFSGEDHKYKIDNVSVKEVGQNWTLSSASIEVGKLTLNSVGGAMTSANQNGLNLVANTTYLISLNATRISGDTDLALGHNAFDNVTGSPIISTSGIQSYYFTPTSNVNNLGLKRNFGGSGAVWEITSFSVIEVLGDKPRIDYSDSSTEPSLLLEPQSTNLIEYSENFSEWEKRGDTTISATNIISPSGHSDATNITGLNGSGGNDLRFYPPGFNSASKTLCFSVYLKGSGTLRLQMSNGVDQGIQQDITLTDNWKRHQALGNFNSTSSVGFHCNIDDLDGQTATQYDVWGAQLEQLSYPTSYIPTSGSTATRLGETANNAGGAGVFNSEEGVLYAEIAALVGTTTGNRHLTISDGTNNNRLYFYYRSIGGFAFASFVGNVLQANITFGGTITNNSKVACVWKENDYSLWVDGVEIGTDTSASVWSSGTLNTLNFAEPNGTVSPFYGKTKNIQVFNYVLTDEELQTLTT